MKKTIILLFILIVAKMTAVACKCGTSPTFLEVAPDTKLVAFVQIKRYLSFIGGNRKIPFSMEVEIINIYKGKEKRKIITIWGDNGGLCRTSLSRFKKGEYYVIALNEGNNGGNELEKNTDFSISNCGEYWLTVYTKEKEKYAVGRIAENQKEISLGKLKEILQVERK